MYLVVRPKFTPTGLKETSIDRFSGRAVTKEIYRADFSEHEDIPVQDMEEAKQLFGGHPILQWVRP